MSLLASPKAVALPAVERELAYLLKVVGEANPPEAPAVMRTLVANVIAFAPSLALGAQAAEALPQVIARHPSRAILLQLSPELPPDETRAEVALACQKAGDAQMCCEYISLTGSGAAADQLPSAALPLLLADLPTFVWWLGDPPFGSAEFDRLCEGSDRMVVDSAQFENPLSTFAEMSVEVGLRGNRTALCDLNWARLTPWRSLLASLFDSRDWRPYLDQLDSVRLEIGRPAGAAAVNPVAGFMLLGWLISRLGWTLEKRALKLSNGSLEVALRAGDRPVKASLVFTTDAPSGRVRLIRVAASKSLQPAEFQITRAYDRPHAETRIAIGDAEPILRVANYEHRGDAELLSEDMERLGRDSVYEASLHAAEAIRSLLKMEMFLPA